MSYLDGVLFPLKPFSSVVAKSQYGLSVVTDDEGDVPMLKMNSISDRGLSLEDLGRITCDQETLEKYRIHRGDFLLNRTNSRELVGKSCVVKKDQNVVFAS